MGKAVSKKKYKTVSKSRELSKYFSIDQPTMSSFKLSSDTSKQWFDKIMSEYTPENKPLVFIPCSKVKPYSKSPTFNFLKPVSKNKNYEVIVLSDGLVVVPRSLMGKMPDYEYSPAQLNADREERKLFVSRLEKFLFKLRDQHGISRAYFIGSTHFENLLREGNKKVKIDIFYQKPERGFRDYNKSAKELQLVINNEWRD